MEGKLGGEVRWLHIIYFLSHMGRVEHPHLVRVHHFTRTGVYLRDVKRWLGDLRGKDMPEAYAWSYKRRYKTGYLWQDLVDDDLITPLSDNEYVLKGSQIISTPSDKKRVSRSYSCPEKKATNDSIYKENSNKVHHQTEDKVQPEKTTTATFSFKESHKKICPDSKTDPPSKIFSKINEESSSFASSERSTLTDDFDLVKLSLSNNNSLPLSTSDHKKSKNKKEKKTVAGAGTGTDDEGVMGRAPAGGSTCLSSSLSKSSLPAKRKSFSSGVASNVIRNFITCGKVDTNDKVLVMLNKNRRSGGGQNDNRNNKARDEVPIRGDYHGRFGRSSLRVFRTCWHHQEEVHQPQWQSTFRRSNDERKGPKKLQTDFSKQRAIPAAYRPVGKPNCSQCGKAFKPEKMHSHMKSCRGMKALAGRSTWSFAPTTSMDKSTTSSHSQQGSTNTSYKESALGYFLTN